MERGIFRNEIWRIETPDRNGNKRMRRILSWEGAFNFLGHMISQLTSPGLYSDAVLASGGVVCTRDEGVLRY